MDTLKKIIAVWNKVNPIQRALLVAVLLASGMIAWLLVYWARRPEMRLLYSGLAPAEASKITEKISERKIPYELRDGGTTVFVDKEQVYQVRLDLAKEGLPESDQGGYKIFDDEKIGVSPFVQNVNLKRALQEELAKSIQMIEGVVYARVHIVSSEQKLFATDDAQTSASVVLKLRTGYTLGAINVAAITHLVSGSVPGLKAEKVTVIDNQGHLLSGGADPTVAAGAGSVQDYKEQVERSLAKKVEDMLTMVLGPGRASVRVSAVVDMNSVSTVTETYEPGSKVAKKEEITSGSEVAGGTAATGQRGPAGNTKKDETVITEYEVGKTVKQEVVLPGKIKSLSVAAFVDLSPPDSNDAAAGATAMVQIADVEQIIRNALGLKETDALKVVNAKFHQPSQPEAPQESSSRWTTYLALAQHLSLGIMAICALIVLRVFRGARKKAAAAAGAKELPEAAGAMGLLTGRQAVSEPTALRRQIAQALRSNPEQVRELFTNWIGERQ